LHCAVVILKLISEVYAGKLHPRVAAGLAPLLNLQLWAVESPHLEQRLEKMKRLLTRGEKEDDLTGHLHPRARDFSKPLLPKV
jgi:hypothetical protein